MTLTPAQRSRVQRLEALCARHDRLEREILLTMRRLPDRVLRALGMAAGGTRK